MPDLPIELVKAALRNAKENGYEEQLRLDSLTAQAVDLHDCDADLQKHKFKDVFDALCAVLLETDVFYFLNKMQLEGRKHRLLDPVHAIRFALHDREGIEFLRCWNEGDWNGCAQWPEWKEFPLMAFSLDNAPTIDLDQLVWDEIGIDDPRARLLAHIRIGPVDMHLEAWEVTHTDGCWVAREHPHIVEKLQDMEETDFRTLEIDGRHYVLHATPYGA